MTPPLHAAAPRRGTAMDPDAEFLYLRSSVSICGLSALRLRVSAVFLSSPPRRRGAEFGGAHEHFTPMA